MEKHAFTDMRCFNLGGKLYPYHVNGHSEPGRIENSIFEILPIISKARILDAGCSDGEGTKELALIYPDAEITGSDKIPERIDKAARKDIPGVNFVVDDLYDSRLGKERFDLVLCNFNVYYSLLFLLEKNDKEGVFVEPSRIVQSVGDLVAQDGYLVLSGGIRDIGVFAASFHKKKGRLHLSEKIQKRHAQGYEDLRSIIGLAQRYRAGEQQ